MEIEKAKWFNNADSPVVLMIDDLANLGADIGRDNKSNICNDWGYWRDLPNSSFAFLQEKLFVKFPKIKTTFFTIIGQPINYLAERRRVRCGPINENDSTINFFRKLHQSPNFEIAYHGLNHGLIRDGKYFNEWRSFNSAFEALGNIAVGQKICQQVFGESLIGGKYPAYASNGYSDESIDKSGFIWWCRHWTYGEFLAKKKDYSVLEMKTFGKNYVVDFPSTVSPHLISLKHIFRRIIERLRSVNLPVIENSLAERSCFSAKRWKFMTDGFFRNQRQQLTRHLEELLRRKEVISIQEHMGAIRADGLRQTPNIIDDMENLQYIFSFLANKNVWNATCSEIANYYLSFNQTEIISADEKGFVIRYAGRIKEPLLTLLVKTDKFIQAISPSGKSYKSIKCPLEDSWGLINIGVENGRYQLKLIN